MNDASDIFKWYRLYSVLVSNVVFHFNVIPSGGGFVNIVTIARKKRIQIWNKTKKWSVLSLKSKKSYFVFVVLKFFYFLFLFYLSCGGVNVLENINLIFLVWVFLCDVLLVLYVFCSFNCNLLILFLFGLIWLNFLFVCLNCSVPYCLLYSYI